MPLSSFVDIYDDHLLAAVYTTPSKAVLLVFSTVSLTSIAGAHVTD